MINRTRMLVMVGSSLLSACATMMSGPRQSVKIDSVPQGARVFTAVVSSNRQGTLLHRREVGVTPMSVSITRKDGVVELEKEGYKVTRVPMHRGTNPWMLGDVLMTSMLSTSIDTSTGAASEYDPDQYLVELEREEALVPHAAAVGSADEAEEPWVPDVRPLSPLPAAPNPAASARPDSK